NDSTYFGALVGRVANRIAGAQFDLNGIHYKLAANEGKNMLHGGPKGFSEVIWNVKSYKQDSHVTFTYHSFDGEEDSKAVHGETSGVNWHDNRTAKDERRRLAATNGVDWWLLRDEIDSEGRNRLVAASIVEENCRGMTSIQRDKIDWWRRRSSRTIPEGRNRFRGTESIQRDRSD
ncbi:aldose 1-epimerase, partial [Sarracenia purpurea var. burkii]